MIDRRRVRGPVSAGELARLKWEKLLNDASYAEQVGLADAARRDHTAALHDSQSTILNDLRRVNVVVDSVWDLVGSSVPYPTALPVLIEHFTKGGYPSRVMEGLGRALAVPSALAYWDQLEDSYIHSRDSGEETGAAVALAACAGPGQLEDLLIFLKMNHRGDSRVYFIRPVLRIGGQIGRDFVEGLRGDPILGKEARALL